MRGKERGRLGLFNSIRSMSGTPIDSCGNK